MIKNEIIEEPDGADKGLNLCNELKLQAKYGADKAHARNEMGNFCKAFGIEKIEAPSTKRKRIIKKGPPKRPFKPRPKPTSSPIPTKATPTAKLQRKPPKNPLPITNVANLDIKHFNVKPNKK